MPTDPYALIAAQLLRALVQRLVQHAASVLRAAIARTTDLDGGQAPFHF